jgi:predicted NAD/FAD-binding protein
LLKLRNRPPWRTVSGGSRTYVERLTESYRHRIRLSAAVASVQRRDRGVLVKCHDGAEDYFDDVVIATPADEALSFLTDACAEEHRILGAFRYSSNLAVLHSDPALMPKRPVVWSSWNHIGADEQAETAPTVTYWMNSLQNLPRETPLFVTLNPHRTPRDEHYRANYRHPLFDAAAISAQKQLWSLQGRRSTWFAGAYFGAGFHEDGLQAGLAVAEALGSVRRPWSVANESGRITIDVRPPALPPAPAALQPEFAA